MENLDSISRYLLQECRIADPDSPADEHGQRVPVKEQYEHFRNWYRDWVDDKMRFMPSKRAFTTEVCRRGAHGMKRGGVRYVYGVRMAGAGEVRA